MDGPTSSSLPLHVYALLQCAYPWHMAQMPSMYCQGKGLK